MICLADYIPEMRDSYDQSLVMFPLPALFADAYLKVVNTKIFSAGFGLSAFTLIATLIGPHLFAEIDFDATSFLFKFYIPGLIWIVPINPSPHQLGIASTFIPEMSVRWNLTNKFKLGLWFIPLFSVFYENSELSYLTFDKRASYYIGINCAWDL